MEDSGLVNYHLYCRLQIALFSLCIHTPPTLAVSHKILYVIKRFAKLMVQWSKVKMIHVYLSSHVSARGCQTVGSGFDSGASTSPILTVRRGCIMLVEYLAPG